MNEDTPEPPLSTSPEPPLSAPPPSALRSIGRSLSNRNYRLFFVGQGISLIGTWMTRVATAWLIFRLSGPDAAFLLGVAGFAGQSPSFFLAPLAGVLVDRWNRHQLLVVTQVLSLIQSALLAVVAFEGDRHYFANDQRRMVLSRLPDKTH